MRWFAIHDAQGDIKCVVESGTPSVATDISKEGEQVTELSGVLPEGGALHYISEGEAVERPDMGITHSSVEFSTEQVITFDNVPEGAVFLHPDGESVIEDGTVSWGSTVAGKFLLRFTKFPYKTEMIRVKVNQA